MGNKGFRISVIDVIAAVVVLGLIAGAVYRFWPGRGVSAAGGALKYTLKINGVRDFTYQYYQEGQLCRDQNTGQEIGRITGVRSAPYAEEGLKTDGTVVAPEKPGIIVIYVDIESPGAETAEAYFAGGTYEIKVGSEIHLITKYIDVTGTVSSVALDG
jgi:hypothetical protein